MSEKLDDANALFNTTAAIFETGLGKILECHHALGRAFVKF